MSSAIRGISSMATRQLLAELAAAHEARSGHPVAIESVGGVDAERRLQAGEPFDVAVLASDAIRRLIAGGHLAAGSRVDLVRSPLAMAVRAGALHPDVGSEASLRQALRAARSVGVSTGPSGAHVTGMFERWGIAGEMAGRFVQAPPGVAVGELVARGEVEIGFQQLSELMHVAGIDVVGTLPPAARLLTTFAAALGPGSARADAVGAMLEFMTSPEAAPTIRRHGMEPA